MTKQEQKADRWADVILVVGFFLFITYAAIVVEECNWDQCTSDTRFEEDW